MKTAVVLLLSCAFLCGAQDSKPDTYKRLESVTWDLATHKLVWTVEKGNVIDGQFVPASKVKYEVSPDEAFMAFAGQQRSFGEDEAVALHRLLDALTIYCVESVIWWDKGAATGAPATQPPGVLTKPEQPPQSKPSVAPEGKPLKAGELIAFKYR